MGKKEEEKILDVATEGAKDVAKLEAEMVTTSAKLARKIWESSKILALKRGISLAKLIEDSLRRELKEEEKKKKGEE